MQKNSKIPKTVIWLGWAMLFSTMCYIMVLGIFGLYLKSIGVSQTKIGFLEGFVEALSLIMKLFSGVLSDAIKNRKILIASGYGLMVLAGPIISISSTAITGTIGRMVNRIGNGLQATPRDALVGDVAPSKKIGQSFGLKRSMGTFGSILGSVIAYMFMYYLNFSFKQIFLISVIPAVLGFLIIIFKIHDIKTKMTKTKAEGFKIESLKKLNKKYFLLMLINAFFMLSRIGETFMSIHGNINFGIPKEFAPIIMIIFNMGYTLSSYPIGVLADKTNRFVFLSLGILAIIIADMIFFAATTIYEFWIGVILWGVQIGITTNIFTSLVIDFSPKDLKGTALGFYFLTSAICILIAESYAGFIAENWGNRTAYLISGFVASLSLLVLVLVMKYHRIHKKI